MAAAPVNRSPQNELVLFYYSIPLITRVLVTATLVISIACHLSFIPYGMVMFDWNSIYKEWKLHKLITPFFIHPVDLSLIFGLLFFYKQSKQLEQNVFWNKPADYVYFIILTFSSSLILAYALGLYFLGNALFFSVMYLWSRHFPTTSVSFFLGITFPGLYVPWISAFIIALFSARVPYVELTGIASSFIYFTFCEYYITAGPKVLSAPEFLAKILPAPATDRPTQTSAGYTAQAPASRPSGQTPEDTWGRGYRLG